MTNPTAEANELLDRARGWQLIVAVLFAPGMMMCTLGGGFILPNPDIADMAPDMLLLYGLGMLSTGLLGLAACGALLAVVSTTRDRRLHWLTRAWWLGATTSLNILVFTLLAWAIALTGSG